MYVCVYITPSEAMSAHCIGSLDPPIGLALQDYCA